MAYTTIDDPTVYFNTILYTGTGSSNARTGVNFQPDWTWIKERAGAAHDHNLTDAVRGVTKTIRSNTTGAETTDAQDLKSFDSDGFTLGTNGGINENGVTFAAWNWKANGAGSANTDGSTNSTKTSANATSKCSIVTYTGNDSNSTVGHGLGVVPASIWVKQLNGSNDWRVYHKTIGATHYLALNTTAGDSSGGEVIWNDTLPTSSVFTIGTNGTVNGGSDTYVAYCFAEVKGFSKIDKYKGNGNADGTFVYTGFKPAWIMIKRADAAGDNWLMHDSKRDGYNGGNKQLKADQANTEGDSRLIHILSNGFKIITADAKINNSGSQYLYWAFAENPFVTSTGIPTLAR